MRVSVGDVGVLAGIGATTDFGVVVVTTTTVASMFVVAIDSGGALEQPMVAMYRAIPISTTIIPDNFISHPRIVQIPNLLWDLYLGVRYKENILKPGLCSCSIPLFGPVRPIQRRFC